MRDIIAWFEAGHWALAAQDRERTLAALRAGQALADELRRVEAALSASGYVLTAKRNAAQTALLAAFPGEETMG